MTEEVEVFHRMSELPRNVVGEEREACERVLLFIHTLGHLLEKKSKDAVPLLSSDMHKLFPMFASMLRWEGLMYVLNDEGKCPAVSLYLELSVKGKTKIYNVNPLVQHIVNPKRIDGLAKIRLIEAGESVFKSWLP